VGQGSRGWVPTIAEAGYAGASFARIAGNLGISRGLISYHFTGKDDLIKQVVHQAAEQAKAYIRPRSSPSQPAGECCGPTSNRTSRSCEITATT
jgi:TetR/AcrR family transcriptional regulator, fatty acid metabolism regulator protein